MSRTSEIYDFVETIVGERVFRIFRFLVSGGTAAASNVLILFLLVHLGNMHYLYASVLAFIASVAVSFTMQKFWTFRDNPVHDMHLQFGRYLLLIGINLFLNTALVYLLVEKVGLWYLFAQIVTTAGIAVMSYFGYRHFVFRTRS